MPGLFVRQAWAGRFLHVAKLMVSRRDEGCEIGNEKERLF